jgi:hypothetical protein
MKNGCENDKIAEIWYHYRGCKLYSICSEFGRMRLAFIFIIGGYKIGTFKKYYSY